jgi:hypothetical protein
MPYLFGMLRTCNLLKFDRCFCEPNLQKFGPLLSFSTVFRKFGAQKRPKIQKKVLRKYPNFKFLGRKKLGKKLEKIMTSCPLATIH